MKKKKASSYEGLQKSVRTMPTPEIEAWENQYPDREYEVEPPPQHANLSTPSLGVIALNRMGFGPLAIWMPSMPWATRKKNG